MQDGTPALTPAPRSRGGAWFLGAVLCPFALTRAALLLTSWYATQFAPSWTYPLPVSATRGFTWTPALWLDVWGRYDTLWYLDVAAHGYAPPADLAHQQSNLAFFPLYPWLVRGLHALLPAAWRGDEARFLVAVALSNALALAGLAAVFLLVRDAFHDEALARRTVLYLLLFPASFFLSCAYSESLFLFLAASTLLLAGRGRFWLAGACALLLGLARPSGVLVAVPLAWMVVERRGPSPSRLRPDVLAIAAAPIGLALHGASLARLTGDPLAVLHAQAAWGRGLAVPWGTLLHPALFHPYMGYLEAAAAVLVLGLGVALIALRQVPLALFTLASLAPILLSGTLMSATRLLVGAFPAFAALAWLGRREAVDRAVVISFTAVQAILFFAWSRFYWVA
jgi:Mannosyltransferase (PIG-V)